MKIWFLTRSLYPYQKTGGGQIRLGQINALGELGWDMEVVMPNYDNAEIKQIKNIAQIPFLQNLRFTTIFQRIGFYEDYFDKWIEKTYDYLKDKISKNDIVFATSGGEMGMIKLGFLLKKELGIKFVVNLHDPLDYTFVNGMKLDNKFHISREKQEYKYLENSDLIITSSNSNKESLEQKYSSFKGKIINNYFGYIDSIDLSLFMEKPLDKLSIAYVGSMGKLQKPEILYNIFQELKSANIKIYFIGDVSRYKPLQNIEDDNVEFVDYMSHEEFLKFMIENVDIGFVSLTNDYLGACVPSKIYEYLNLGLPMIGALPDGDGKEIINENNYGIACKYDDIKGLINATKKFTDTEFLKEIRSSILKNRSAWSMKERIKEVDILLKKLVNED